MPIQPTPSHNDPLDIDWSVELDNILDMMSRCMNCGCCQATHFDTGLCGACQDNADHVIANRIADAWNKAPCFNCGNPLTKHSVMLDCPDSNGVFE